VGSVGAPEVLVILVLALLVLGPERLPQAARTMGRWVAEIRKITGTLQAEVQDVVDEVMRPVNDTPTVATDSFTSTVSTADGPASAAVEPETATAASPSLATSDPLSPDDGGPRLAADVPLPSSFPAPPVDPSLN
jgi:sec-independent protein translocase protein TatB